MISGCQLDDDGSLALSMISNSTLISVEFTESFITDKGIGRLCKGCSSLKRLSLEASDDNLGLTDASVSSIVKYHPGIEHLSLSGWSKITDASMVAMTALTSLKKIDLSRCSDLTSAGVQGLLRTIGANIEVLLLSPSDTIEACAFCDAALMRCIGECCPKLKNFSVNGESLSADTTEGSLIAFIRGCPLLETLDWYCRISDAILIQLAASCPRLTKVVIYHGLAYSDIGIAALTSHCKQLSALSILKARKLVTTQSFASISMHCRYLKELTLNRIPRLTDQALSAVFESLKHLTVVGLGHLPLITDISIFVLARECLSLKKLVLHCTDSLTDKSMAAIVALKELKDIRITYCATLSDHTVQAIATNCTKLTSVMFRSCALVSERGVIDTLVYGKRLRIVTITRCNVTLTAELMDEHLQSRPWSRRIDIDLGELGYFAL